MARGPTCQPMMKMMATRLRVDVRISGFGFITYSTLKNNKLLDVNGGPQLRQRDPFLHGMHRSVLMLSHKRHKRLPPPAELRNIEAKPDHAIAWTCACMHR